MLLAPFKSYFYECGTVNLTLQFPLGYSFQQLNLIEVKKLK